MSRGRSFARFTPPAEYEDMMRLHTMATLGESLFEIQMKIENYKLLHTKLERTARERLVNGPLSDNDLWRAYRQIRETEIQRMALVKSERVLKMTLTGLENQATMDRMRKVLTHTVHQHRMVQEHGMLDANSESEKLMETFDQMTQYISQGQTAIDSMASQTSDMQTEILDDNVEITADSSFMVWKDVFLRNLAASNAGSALSEKMPPVPLMHTPIQT